MGECLYKLGHDCFQRAAAAVAGDTTNSVAPAEADGCFADFDVWTLGGFIDVMGFVDDSVVGGFNRWFGLLKRYMVRA